MPGIMADNDVIGQFRTLLTILESKTWHDVWPGLKMTVETFESLGLATDAPDVLVWKTCQDRGVVLFTGNRNDDGPDSLEATIRSFNQAQSLPVITLGDPERFTHERSYRRRVAVRLLETLMDLEKHLGSGRLYVP